MMKRSCVVAGSFDPVTRGHLHVVHAAQKVFDNVFVAVLNNASKEYMFTSEQRLELLEIACREPGLGNVRTLAWDGLLVSLLDELHIEFVVRGIRDARDADAERQIAAVNEMLRPGTMTVWVSGSAETEAVSSTIVRELIQFGADIRILVPDEVAERICEMRSANAHDASDRVHRKGGGGRPRDQRCPMQPV